jgi:hypothetical protein
MSYLRTILATGLTVICCMVLPTDAFCQTAFDELARDVERAESIRAVKNLQRTYAQYSQYALWNEMADLFAEDAGFISGDDSVKGRKEITEFLIKHEGAGHHGLLPGEVHTQLIDEPVVNLSLDGRSAKGRWYGFFLLCDSKGNAEIEGGVFENRYVKQKSGWKIMTMHYYPQFAGPYETGWKNWKGQDLPIVPYHYTPDESGIPVPPPVGKALPAASSLDELEERIKIMNDENLIRNLQAAYGYYVNRRMWEDIKDMFADDGVYEVGGVGIYEGRKGVGRALELMGPEGLTHGVLNDRLQFDTVISISPGRREARARGIEMGMLGEADKSEAWWEVSVFYNRFVKEDGLWRIREMRIFPLFRSEYSKGWGKSRITAEVPGGELAPDRPLPDMDTGGQDRIIPAFLTVNPATGKTVALPSGMRFAATQPLTGPVAEAQTKKPFSDRETRIKEAARMLAVAKAYDGAENISSAYGQLIDDFQWPQMAALFGKTGTKQFPFAGYYTGSDRIARALFLEYGDPVTTRPGIAYHWRIQPVINIAPDGRSVRLRTYLFHPNTGIGSSTLFGAIYPDDHIILEDGIWRFWNLSLDEPYFSMTDWKSGWAVTGGQPSTFQFPGPKPGTGITDRPQPKRYIGPALVAHYPPEVPITSLGKRQEHFRGGTGEPWEWPMILPMWWGYRNPVSGRTPELFLPDCVPCDYAPDMSMVRHGYLLPPTGPVKSED